MSVKIAKSFLRRIIIATKNGSIVWTQDKDMNFSTVGGCLGLCPDYSVCPPQKIESITMNGTSMRIGKAYDIVKHGIESGECEEELLELLWAIYESENSIAQNELSAYETSLLDSVYWQDEKE